MVTAASVSIARRTNAATSGSKTARSRSRRSRSCRRCASCPPLRPVRRRRPRRGTNARVVRSAARDLDRDASPFGGKASQPRVARVLRTPIGNRVVDEREHRAHAAVTALDAPFQAVESVADAEHAHLHPAEILIGGSEVANAGLCDRSETRDEKGDGKKRAAHENLQAYYRGCRAYSLCGYEAASQSSVSSLRVCASSMSSLP